MSSKATPKLTKREESILRGVAAGLKYTAIGYKLEIGFETVKHYIKRLKTKIGVDSKVGLAVWATENLK